MNLSVVGIDLWNSSTNRTAEDGYFPSLEVLEPGFQIALILVYSLTATLSLTGNLTVIAILGCGKRSSGALRLFLINLAVSDVTMAVFSIPFTYTMFLLGRWVFTPWFCPLVLGMQHVSVFVSVYTLTAIGIDRYRAIVTPFNRRINKNQSKWIVVGIWFVAFTVSSVQLYVSSAKELVFYTGETYYECAEWWDSEVSSQVYTVFIFTFTFFIPLIGLAYTYSAIAWSLWWRVSPGNAYHHRDKAQFKSKIKFVMGLLQTLATAIKSVYSKVKSPEKSIGSIIKSINTILNSQEAFIEIQDGGKISRNLNVCTVIIQGLPILTTSLQVIKMLVTIVILFAFCWLPLQLFLLIYYFYPEISTYTTESEKRIYALSYFFCHWLANANSFVNPLVYCFMSDNFRADLKELTCYKRKRKQRPSTRSYTTRATLCPMVTTYNNGTVPAKWKTIAEDSL